MATGWADDTTLSPFVCFSREEWGRLRANTSLALSEDDVRDLRRTAGHLSLEEATEVYLPLSWLLYLHVRATRDLYRRARAFLGKQAGEVPYVVGIAGSVAVGKSTVAQMVQALVSRWPGRPKVELVSTDGFLYPNRVLQSRGLMDRKGFPESYDLPLLLRFLADVKAGRTRLSVPIHSHLTYDILPDEAQHIGRSDVLIVEGLNLLEAGLPEPSEGHRVFVSDYVDFSLYVDAEERYIKGWYLDRFISDFHIGSARGVPYSQCAKKPRASSSVTAHSARCVASNSASRVLAFAFLKMPFTLEKASSMGLKSGE